MVFLVVLSEECKRRQLLLRDMQYGSNITSFSLSWDPGGCPLQLICDAHSVDLEMNNENDNIVGIGERQEVGAWLVVGKILSCSGLGKHEHKHDWVSSNNGKTEQQLCGVIRLWDPGVSQAETIFFHLGFLGRR